MELIILSPLDLVLAAALVLGLAALSLRLGLGVERRLLVAAARSTLQLGLIGLVLKTLFQLQNPALVGALALVMLLAAGYEVMARQQRRFSGFWGMGIGTLSMFLSSFGITLLAFIVIMVMARFGPDSSTAPLLENSSSTVPVPDKGSSGANMSREEYDRKTEEFRLKQEASRKDLRAVQRTTGNVQRTTECRLQSAERRM